MAGFQDPIAGAGGNLLITSIQSPNFSIADGTGWAIMKNGDAWFYNITLPPGNTITITFAATAPASPSTGDLWYDTANGNQVSQWDGSAWVAYQWGTASIASGAITASEIAANTITAAQLAAGIVYAGIVDSTTVNAATFTGSTFEGTDFIINSLGAFYYSGTPAAGNLIASSAQASGTDGFGNHYLTGHATYASGFATSLDAGYVAFYTGSLSAGWTYKAQIETDSGGDLILSPAGDIQLAAATTAGGNLTVYPYNLILDMGVPTGYPYSEVTATAPSGAWYANVDGVLNALVTGVNALIAEMDSRGLIS